ncbi:MAG: tRNA uridine-5-carboxymethylaminomethyl(34) synthesis GTPase MnmE [Spirochaetales bacterium]
MKKIVLGYDIEDPICALATPWGTSALAVLRTSGEGVIEKVAEIFSKPEKLRGSTGGRIHHGYLVSPETREPIDEVMVAVYRSPHSYTGEDSVEIFSHGSLPGIRTILEALRTLGFRPAEPGEFTYRAFIHGKMDLTRAEAVQEIVSSKTQKAHLLALHRLEGGLSNLLVQLKEKLLDLLTTIEIQLDYPEEDAPTIPITKQNIEPILQKIEHLLQTYGEAKLYQEGVRIAIAGKTNAGKSSLFNRFLKEERSIVSEIHGTTRDYIEATLSIGGIPVRLYDTAGLRVSTDPIEVEGVKRSYTLLQSCALILYLIDCTDKDNNSEEFLKNQVDLQALSNRLLPVYTKIDLDPNWSKRVSKTQFPFVSNNVFGVSSVTGEGIDSLLKEIEHRLKEGVIQGKEEILIESDRQKELLERGKQALERFLQGIDNRLPLDVLSQDIQEALRALGEITGELTTEDMLHRMFSNFCVGK